MQLNSTDISRRILLIDDDLELAQMLREYLEPAHYSVTAAHTCADGDALLARGDHDVALIDLMLPDGNGLDVLRRHRARSPGPVIMFTAHGDETDRVLGLEFGADDYLAKPFSPRELRARIQAVMRRFDGTAAANPNVLSCGALTLDAASGVARLGVDSIMLTGAESRVLEVLMRSAGQLVTRDQIGQFALGRMPERFDRSVDTHVSNLRRKLRLDTEPAQLSIRNVRGRGYALAPRP